jgi:hypothetical protein
MNTVIPIILAVILYVWIAIGQAARKDWPMCLVWTAYSLSQIGFLLHEIYKKDLP